MRIWFWGLILILGIFFLTLRPSFNLALTGDDYLGLWRYQFYVNGWGGEKMSNLAYFFTDYGPMDMLTAFIHNYYGFNHRIYYIFSFVFRLAASLSLILPVYKLTKNKWASIVAAGFFSITTTGLEATDWSFNMPSYLGIALLNTFLFCFITSRTKDSFKLFWLQTILFVATIVVQPIRMIFLPGLVIALEGYWILAHVSKKRFMVGGAKIFTYLLLTFAILRFTSIGGAVSARGSDTIAKNYGSVLNFIKRGDVKVLISPIKQIGTIIFPNVSMYQRFESWGLFGTFKRVVVPTFCLYVLALIVIRLGPIGVICGTILGGGWTWLVWNLFYLAEKYPLQPFELMAYLLGGYFLILISAWWLKLGRDLNIRLGLIISVLIMVLGFTVAWLRNPGVVYEISGRYLIVPGVGLSWFVGMMAAVKSSFYRKLALLTSVGLLFSVHGMTSYKYLSHLSDVRGIELTDRLRNSVKRAEGFGSKEPLVFYFEGDDPEIVHHAFIFGFPVIAHFQFDITGPWYNIAPTDKWEEVVSAYNDGQSLKRFMVGPYNPVKLENIYAYRVQSRHLMDLTAEKRELLKRTKYVEKKPN